MTTHDEAKARAAATYNAAADHYDDPANVFWDHFGATTVARLALPPGGRVLDACCGSGASALPAAQAVGPGGSVIAVDLADGLLALARDKARRLGLTNVEFRQADLMATGFPPGHFDAVVCVFGIFFLPDMPAAVRELWRLVAPGGQLAITTWGPRFFEPVTTEFWNAVRGVRPDLYKAFNPWDRIATPDALSGLLAEAGIDDRDVVAQAGSHAIPSPDAWWAAVMGSGYRGTIDQMHARERDQVRAANESFIREAGVARVEANVVYARAAKPR